MSPAAANLLAIDQGTTGTTALLYDRNGKQLARAYREFEQHFPQPGWVEHDPETIWQTVVATVTEVLQQTGCAVEAIGITNQRETTVVWDRETGKPIHRAIVWQCRRTAEMCAALQARTAAVRHKTGLPIDPYFSATKIRWLLDHANVAPGADLAFGTMDSWIIWKLTGGKAHVTDHTNAARTLLYNIMTRAWDPSLCELFGVPVSMLPAVQNSCGQFGVVSSLPGLEGVPIMGVAGDQQAALFGHTAFDAGQAKNTYGTGAFVVVNTGTDPVMSESGLLTTLAVDAKGNPCYALEGSIFIAGAALQWLRDQLQILDHAAASDAAARRLNGNDGVYLVPAFCGLGAPYWESDARGMLTGLTRGTSRDHIIRAALEAMAYQTRDVLQVMAAETGRQIEELAVDGGASANDFLMQFQADIAACRVLRPADTEATALGAAYLAGLAAGVWSEAADLRQRHSVEHVFEPDMTDRKRQELLAGWEHALRQARKK